MEKGLRLDVLKNALSEDDFGLSMSSNKEIDSIASLDALSNITEPVVTPGQTTQTTSQSTTQSTITPEIEEIVDEEIEVPVTTDTNSTDTNAKKTDLLKVFASNLAANNLIEFSEEEFDKAEDKDKFFENKITERINKEAENKFNEKYSELPPEIDKLIELHKKGVPLYSVLEADAKIATLDSIKSEDIETDVELQKDILRELYSLQGFSKEKIDSKIKRAEDLATLKDDSIEGFDILKEHEKKAKDEMIKNEQIKFQKQEEERLNKLKAIEDSIKQTDEIIPGFKLSEEDKKTLINGITKPVAKDAKGNPINALAKARLDDPKMDLKVAYFTLILKGNLDKLQNKAATKVTRSLKDVVDSTEPIHGSTSKGPELNAQTTVNKDVLKSALKYLKRNT